MLKRKLPLLLGIGTGSCLFFALYFAYQHETSSDAFAGREEMLMLTPADSSEVVFLDLREFRSSPFLLRLFAWAPRPTPDGEYAQFVAATGFDYERDLDRVAVAISRQGFHSSVVAIAEGRFDRKKIEEHGAQFGKLKNSSGKTIYAVPVSGPAHTAFFTFLRNDRIAWSNDASYFAQPRGALSSAEWREHFSRLAGTPLFAVLREDSAAVSTFAEQAPGGLRSPQLASLISQLQWITIGGKPDGDLLRVVIDGECLSEGTVHQLKEMLSGIVVLAEMGLNDPKTRKRVDSSQREAYLELLQSADIQQLDRGTSKSVRVVFDLTPKVLQAARPVPKAADTPVPAHKQ